MTIRTIVLKVRFVTVIAIAEKQVPSKLAKEEKKYFTKSLGVSHLLRLILIVCLGFFVVNVLKYYMPQKPQKDKCR